MNRARWVVLAAALAAGTSGVVRAQGGQVYDAGPYVGTLWTINDGLPQNTVYGLVQTQDGYLWLGTDAGLARFDGMTFTAFSPNADGVFRPDLVSALYEDQQGTLWAGAYEKGAARYVPPTVGAAQAHFDLLSQAAGLPSDNVWAFAEDAAGALWVATSSGIARLQDGRATVFTEAHGLPSSFVPALLVDRTGALWAGTYRGLAYFDSTSFVPVSLGAGEAVRINALAQAPDGTLWVGTQEGLYHHAGVRTRHYTTREGLASGVVQAVHLARDGAVWIGTDAPVVHRLDPDGTLLDLPTGPPRQRGGVRSILEDREGNLWVGTYGYGLVRLRRKVITHLTEEDGLASNLVRPILEARNGDVWIGTRGGAVHRLRDGQLRAFRLAGATRGNAVQSLFENPSGVLWVAFTGRGVARLEGDRLVPVEGLDRLGTAPLDPLSLLEDRQGRLWVGLLTQGLLRRDPDGRVHHFTTADGLPDGTVRVLVQDRLGRIWAGTDAGLVQLEATPAAPRFQVFTTDDGLAEDAVFSIVEDLDRPAGTLWIGGETRLTRYTPGASGGTFTPLAYERMLLDDGRGALWTRRLNTLHRVAKRDLHALADGALQHVIGTSYGSEVGLEGEGVFGFSPPASHTRDGRLLFPTTSGVAIVELTALPPAVPPPPVYITSIEADTVTYERDTAPARLGPGLGRLVVHYAGLSFSAPGRTRYRHRLEGFEDEWVEAGPQRSAVYTNLAPGRYIFLVEAVNHQGTWSTAPARYAFVVQPSFTQTALFRVLLGLALLGLGLIFYGLRVRGLRRQEQLLREQVRLRTADLQREKERTEAALQETQAARALVEQQAEQLKALDAAKSRLFENLSHEFRTPLTLILGPLEQALATAQASDDLRTAHDQAARLLDLVGQLLDLAKLEAGSLTLQRAETDLGGLGQRVVGSFQSLAQRQGIYLTMQIPEAPLLAFVEAAHVERVLTNLVANALAHTPSGGRIAVTLQRVGAKGDGAPAACFTVRDSGTGIPPEALACIFDRFYQVTRGPHARAGQVGTGIGLALAKELVELHGGTIHVESEVGFGSTFTVTLPLGQAGLQPVLPPRATPEPRPYLGTAPAAEAEASPVQPGTGPSLLIVEDHAALRDFLARSLADAFTVVVAGDGAEGLRLARQHCPDLIVSDVMMPELDGFQLTAALRADEALRETPVLLLTARADAEGEIAGLEAGADDYLAKPFSLPVLRAHLDALLARHRDLKDRFRRQVVVQPSEVVVTSEEAAFVERVRTEVEAALDDPHLTVEALAERLAVSPRHLHRRMRTSTGLSPAAFVRSMRLQRAAQLLAGRSGTVAEVAYEVGFRSVSHFTKRFKAEFGVLPSAYREEL